MVTVQEKSFITLPIQQWKRKQKADVHAEQKRPATAKTANVSVNVVKAENAPAKGNAHAAASANNNNTNNDKKEKVNNQYPEGYQSLTSSITIRNHRYISSFTHYPTRMNLDNKPEILLSIRKAAGTIKKIEKMIEDDVYCADIAQQVNAAIGLLKSANNKLLEHHIKCCGARKLLSNDKKEIDDFVKELVRVRNVSTRK